MKKIVYLVLMLLALYAVIFTDFGILKTKEKLDSVDEALTTYATAKSRLEAAKSSLTESENAFASRRTFEIAYNDITKLVQVLNNVMTVTVSSVNVADPHQYFVAGVPWDGSSDAEAIVISLTVEDTSAALRIINRMELPIYSIVVTEPNIVNVTFLTGGAET